MKSDCLVGGQPGLLGSKCILHLSSLNLNFGPSLSFKSIFLETSKRGIFNFQNKKSKEGNVVEI